MSEKKAKEGEVVKPKTAAIQEKKTDSTKIILVVVFVMVALCGLCGLCGSIPFFLNSLGT
jgi:flagellar basal body-associated protein FliL